jgi:hypothetical protein
MKKLSSVLFNDIEVVKTSILKGESQIIIHISKLQGQKMLVIIMLNCKTVVTIFRYSIKYSFE